MGKLRNIVETLFYGIISTIIASFLLENLNYLMILLIFIFITGPIGIIIFTYRRYPKYFGKKGSFAVTALIFNNKKEILLIHHRRQKKWVPPGKHLEKSLKPHEEILNAVKEETGYNAEFHPFHNITAPKIIDRFSTEVPQPFYILEETQLPKEGHVFHYDLFYICKVNHNEKGLKGSERKEWIPLENLDDLVGKQQTYPDVKRIAIKAFEVISP